MKRREFIKKGAATAALPFAGTVSLVKSDNGAKKKGKIFPFPHRINMEKPYKNAKKFSVIFLSQNLEPMHFFSWRSQSFTEKIMTLQ